MKRITIRSCFLAVLPCVLSTALLAQTATPPPAPGTETARSQRQQQRIGQGVESGQMTARETGNVEHREASVHSEKRAMRASDSGHLTGRDRRALNQRQNHISKSIYKDKHNARVR